jgi:Double-GTPase 2
MTRRIFGAGEGTISGVSGSPCPLAYTACVDGGDLIVLTLGIALFAFLVGVALVVAGAIAVVSALDTLAVGIHALVGTLVRGINNRGGANAAPEPPEPAYVAYVRSQLWRDLLCALRAGRAAVNAHRGTIAARSASVGDHWYTTPLRVGVVAGAWSAWVLGVLIGVILAGIAIVIVGFAIAIAWLVGAPLRLFERGRRSLRGAHFDCPHCRERFVLPIHRCPGCGAAHTQLVPSKYGILRRRCSCDAMMLPTLQLNGRQNLPAECPNGHRLGSAIGMVRTLHVPISAGASAGKTTFLAAAFVELSQLVKAGRLAMDVLPDSKTSFEALVSGFSSGVLPQKTVNERAPALVAEVRGGGSSALLYAYDVAGEAFSETDKMRRDEVYGLTSGVVLLIDPLSLGHVQGDRGDEIEAGKEFLKPSSEDPQRVLERLVGVLAEKGVTDLSKRSLAVVLTKVDALGIDGAIDALPGEEDSQRVRAWLEGHGAGNLVRTATSTFGTVKYFRCSALGRTPSGAAGAFMPRGALAPLLWILERNGLAPAKSTNADSTVTHQLEAEAGRRGAKPARRVDRGPIDTGPPLAIGGRMGLGTLLAILFATAAAGVGSLSAPSSQGSALAAANSGSQTTDSSGTSSDGSSTTTADSSGTSSDGSSTTTTDSSGTSSDGSSTTTDSSGTSSDGAATTTTDTTNTTSGSSGSAKQLSTAEQNLVARVSPRVSASCSSNHAETGAGSGGATASVLCVDGNVGVRYYTMTSDKGMKHLYLTYENYDAYKGLVDARCGGGGSGSYQDTNTQKGRGLWFCYTTYTTNRRKAACIAWIDFPTRIYSHACRADLHFKALMQWWQRQSLPSN